MSRCTTKMLRNITIISIQTLKVWIIQLLMGRCATKMLRNIMMIGVWTLVVELLMGRVHINVGEHR